MIFLYGIQEADKPNLIFKIGNIVQLKGNKIILPLDGEKELSSRKAHKLAQKTKKILDKSISKKIVMSEKVQKQEEYVNLLYTNSFEICEGKWLFEALSCQILDYLLDKKEIKKEETDISILVNDLSDNMLANIRKIAKEYKRVKIITNHIERFRIIEKQILEQDGIMITIGNNKRKGLCKSRIILNVDFPSELINQYQIYENAIIVNIRGNVKITKKRFNGITINDYDITCNKLEEFNEEDGTKYKICKIYEAEINKKQPYHELMKQIQRDGVKILQLVGMNTKL